MSHEDPGDCDPVFDVIMQMAPQDSADHATWVATYNDYFGGPLVMAGSVGMSSAEAQQVVADYYRSKLGASMTATADEAAADNYLIAPPHKLDEGGVCMRCRKTASDIANNPNEECLLAVDFSLITRTIAGGAR